MRAPLLLLGGIVVFSVAVARALSCVCSPLECDVLTDEDCPGGLTWDPCRCCKVCARVEGEPCGGLFGFSGSCADGLQCVIKNLLHHAGEVDEGVCAKIPGRWRRHCPNGPKMSDPGCNLVGEGLRGNENIPTGKCVCGPSVPWCPDEPKPYVYRNRHECKLNLAAKITYDDLFNSGDTASGDVEGSQGAECPEDSIRSSNGSCKCAECVATECQAGQRAVPVKLGDPETPGSCCTQYNCVPAGTRDLECPEDSTWTEDGECRCLSCSVPTCRPGQRPVQVRPALAPETPGSCCPLYECRASESVSLVETDEMKTRYCIHEKKARELGERWKESVCTTCVCEEDGVSCQESMCKSCENATPPEPDECCPHCPSNVTIDPVACRSALKDCNLTCDHGFINDENNCPTCECATRKDTNQPPVVQDNCPETPECSPSCNHANDDSGCPVCVCPPFDNPSNSSVDKKVCPEVKCDLHCERGLVMDENDCTFCKCRPPAADCPPLTACRKRCPFGYKTNKRGCPICRCRASCMDHLNETHPEGATWHPNSCTTCTCESGGRLNCKETICSVACSNPLPPKPGTCCPLCPIAPPKEPESVQSRGWGTVPITLIVILALLCLLLIVHTVRGRFRGRLSPSETSYTYPPQYYTCVPAYDTPVPRNEKIVRL